MNYLNHCIMLDNILLLEDNYQQTVSLISGVPKFSEWLFGVQPSYMQLLINKEINKSELNTYCDPNDEEFNYFHMLPETEDDFRQNPEIKFLGLGIGSSTIFYGDKFIIQEIINEMDEILTTQIFESELDFETSGYGYFLWNLKEDKSLLVYLNDYNYGIQLTKSIKNKEVIRIDLGGNAEDSNIIELVNCYIVKPLLKNTDLVLDEEVKDFYLNNPYCDSIFYNGKKMKKSQIPELLKMTEILYKDIMQWDKCSDDFVKNITNAIIQYNKKEA